MWPNGDTTESEAYRASRRFVTDRAQGDGERCTLRRREELSCRHQRWTAWHPALVGTARGRRRKQLVLVASALAVLAVAVGVSLAVATRPIDRQAVAQTGADAPTAADDQNANAGQDQGPGGPGRHGRPAGHARVEPGPRRGRHRRRRPRAEDGDPAYITKVDGANDRIVVDVVQVFNDDEAVKAAIADGKSPAEAKYLTGWVRNENPRLRTLPLAADLKVDLLGTCEESGSDREAVLTRLAANAKRMGNYYFMLTVSDGTVQRIQERLAINAC